MGGTTGTGCIAPQQKVCQGLYQKQRVSFESVLHSRLGHLKHTPPPLWRNAILISFIHDTYNQHIAK